MKLRTLFVGVVVAFLAGVVVVGGWWAVSTRELHDREALVEKKRRELVPLQSIAAEVDQYQKKKSELQWRIDVINQLKQNQFMPSNEVAVAADVMGLHDVRVEEVLADRTLELTVTPTSPEALLTAEKSLAQMQVVDRGSVLHPVLLSGPAEHHWHIRLEGEKR